MSMPIPQSAFTPRVPRVTRGRFKNQKKIEKVGCYFSGTSFTRTPSRYTRSVWPSFASQAVMEVPAYFCPTYRWAPPYPIVPFVDTRRVTGAFAATTSAGSREWDARGVSF